MQSYANCTLSTSYIEGANIQKRLNAVVGQRIGEWTVLGFWVNENNLLKAVKVQCTCGTIDEYKNSNALKDGTSFRCKICSNGHPAHYELHQIYGKTLGEKIWRLWNDRYRTTKRNDPDKRKHLHQNWMDHVEFAKYITSVPNFDKWPKYNLDRIDNNMEYGYQPGNVRFVPPKDNVRNKSEILKITYRGKEYTFTEFLETITGVSIPGKIYGFMRNRIFKGKRTTVQALNELYNQRNKEYPWPSIEVKNYFINWYNHQVNKQINRF